MAKELGLKPTRTGNHTSFARHPLAFLVEAADDICYTIIDFEDGINLGLIQEEFALEYLSKIIRHNIKPENYYALSTKEDRVGYLRALAIGSLINEAVDIFMKHEAAILNGDFDCALLDKSKYEAQINDIIKLSVENIYQSIEVVEKEISGYKVITKLLETYILAVNNCYNNHATNYDKLILKTLPNSVKVNDNKLYIRVLSVCHYISLLSDSNAILIYKKLMGMTL